MSKKWKQELRDEMLSTGTPCTCCGGVGSGITSKDGKWYAICTKCRNKLREERRKTIVPDKRPRISGLLKKIDELESEIAQLKKELKNGR